MRLRQCEYFDAVLRTGSIRAAGAELRVSEPAISAALRELERELRVVLFERDGLRGPARRGVGPTHPLARRESLTVEDISDQPLILYRNGYLVRELVLRLLGEQALSNLLCTSDNGATTQQLGQYKRAQRDLGSTDNMRIAPCLAAKAAGATSEEAVLAARKGILPNARRTARDISALVALVAEANAMACQEACAVARSHGLNVETMLDVVNMSSGASRFTADPRRTPRNADATALPFELDTAPVLARAASNAVADRRL